MYYKHFLNGKPRKHYNFNEEPRLYILNAFGGSDSDQNQEKLWNDCKYFLNGKPRRDYIRLYIWMLLAILTAIKIRRSYGCTINTSWTGNPGETTYFNNDPRLYMLNVFDNLDGSQNQEKLWICTINTSWTGNP